MTPARTWLRERRLALKLTQAAVGKAANVSTRTVQRWEAGGATPTDENRKDIAAALDCSEADVEQRLADEFATLGGTVAVHGRDLRVAGFLPWVVQRSPLSLSQTYDAVAERVATLEAEPNVTRLDRLCRREQVDRVSAFEMLEAFYGPAKGSSARFYRVRVGNELVSLGMLVRGAREVELALPLGAPQEQAHFESPAPQLAYLLSPTGLELALDRLAEVELDRTVLVDRPLYRLLHLPTVAGAWRARWSCVDFLSFALTNDLLELELLDAIAGGGAAADLCLRRDYLRTTEAALDLSGRACVGGIVALVAIARRDEGDYALVVQERSQRVLNLAGRLSVIPRAFHQPVREPARDLPLRCSLLREVEEELLGRDDLELLREDRRLDPLHPARWSEAMQALLRSGACRMELTGFGINAMNGNYEVTVLVVIDDVEWWSRFGHQVEANWEATGLRCYSSLDGAGIEDLVHDGRWSDGGLFGLLQGLRRLAKVRRKQVSLPAIELRL